MRALYVAFFSSEVKERGGTRGEKKEGERKTQLSRSSRTSVRQKGKEKERGDEVRNRKKERERESTKGNAREEWAEILTRPIGHSSNDDDNDGNDNQRPTSMSDVFRCTNGDDERCRAAIKLIPPANWYRQFLSLGVPTTAR